MCFIDYNFFPVLFFLGWNIFTAKQFMPNIYRYGFIRNENKDSSITFPQTKFPSGELSSGIQTNSNFLNLFQTPLKYPATDTQIKKNNILRSSLKEEIELILNFCRLKREYKDISSQSSKNLMSNHDINNQKQATLYGNYMKYKHSQNFQRSLAYKTQFKPLGKRILPYFLFSHKTVTLLDRFSREYKTTSTFPRSFSIFNFLNPYLFRADLKISIPTDLLNFTYKPKNSIIFSSKSINKFSLQNNIKTRVNKNRLIGLNSLNQISSFYFTKPNTFVPNWINRCSFKFPAGGFKIHADSLKKLKTNTNNFIESPYLFILLNNNKGLSFFSKKNIRHVSLLYKNETVYYNRFDSLVQKSESSKIKNKIQKRQEKRIQFLLQTPSRGAQKIYSLQKFQIPLCFSSAI